MKEIILVLIGAALLALFLVGVYRGAPAAAWRAGQEQCLTGIVLIPSEGGLVAFGEQQLCGKDLRWSGVYGPSIEEWKKSNAPVNPLPSTNSVP